MLQQDLLHIVYTSKEVTISLIPVFIKILSAVFFIFVVFFLLSLLLLVLLFVNMGKPITNVRRNKCAYKNCNNMKAGNSDIRLFRFPTDKNRCQQWLLNSGNIDLLELSPESLYKKKVLCSIHFCDEDYANQQIKCRLKKTAVPSKFIDIENTIKTEVETPSPENVKIFTSIKTYHARAKIILSNSPQLSTSHGVPQSPSITSLIPRTNTFVGTVTDMSHESPKRKILRRTLFPKISTTADIQKANSIITKLKCMLLEKTNTIKRLKIRIDSLKKVNNSLRKVNKNSTYSYKM